jgi:hypothetical protein
MPCLVCFLVTMTTLPPAGQSEDPPGEPPVAGRPAHFSGAIGSYKVEMRADPTTLKAEDALTLTVRITGKDRLKGVSRPDLGRISRFARQFHIENASERDLPDELAREFDYCLRPRSPDVKEVPSLPFAYFKPGLLPPERGYQTAYAKAIPLTVTPRGAVRLPPAQGEPERGQPPDAVYRLAIGEQVLRSQGEPIDFPVKWVFVSVVVLALFIVGTLGNMWQEYWRTRGRIGLFRGRGPARQQLDALLELATNPKEDRPSSVAAVLLGYLRPRLEGLPESPTSTEVFQHLKQAGIPEALAEKVGLLLNACDAARFADEPRPSSTALAADASRLILVLESQPWPSASC